MFTPGNYLNWQSLIDLTKYLNNKQEKEDINKNKDLYREQEIIPLCNWSEIEIIKFKTELEKNKNKKDSDFDENLFMDSMKDIIDFGLPYQEDFFKKYKEKDYYYKLGLNKLIPNIDKEKLGLDDLLTKFKDLNKNIQDHDFNLIKNSIKEIKENTEQNKNSDIKIWLEKNRENQSKKLKENISSNEIITYINIGFNKIYDHELRETQLLSLLVLINKKEDKGRIVEVLTGEGKTYIIVALAIFQVLKGHKVDIVTSNEILAKRDSEKNKKIYELFDISVNNCINEGERKEGPKKIYDSDIVYGDTHNFQADFLYDEYYSEGTKCGRKPDVIIVDEIDSMFVDEYAKSTLLAGRKPFMEYLNPILIMMYSILNDLIMINEKSSNYKNYEKILVDIGDKMIKGYNKKLGDNDIKLNPLPLPDYLKDYAQIELEKWAKNAIYAYNLEIDESYTIRPESEDKINPVDYENTGVIQKKTKLSGGLHQFLEIKNNYKMTPINIITNFQSNYGFFNLYRGKNGDKEYNNIYGLTGTLGSEINKNLLEKIYSLDFSIIPPFFNRKLKELCPRLEGKNLDVYKKLKAENTKLDISSDNWIKTIKETSLKASRNGREVLIICKTIKIAKEIISEFKRNDIFIEKTSKINDDLVVSIINQDAALNSDNYNNKKPGTIIVATNIAGRGMDINLTEEVIKNKGLHVCLTFLPRNNRVQRQAFGRAGRKGEPGTWQLVSNFLEDISEVNEIIFSDNNIKIMQDFIKKISDLQSPDVFLGIPAEKKCQHPFNKNEKIEYGKLVNVLLEYQEEAFNKIEKPYTYEKLIIERDKKEEKELKEVEDKINKIKKRDELFLKYLKFLKEKKDYLKVKSKKFYDIEEQWGFYLNKVLNAQNITEINVDDEFKKWEEDYSIKNLKMKNIGFVCNEIQNNFIENKYIQYEDESEYQSAFNDLINYFSSNKEGKEKIKKNLSLLKDYIEDNNFSFIPLYYFGICNILLNEKEEGKKYLKKSKELLEKEYKYYFNFSISDNISKKYIEEILNKACVLWNIDTEIITPIINEIESKEKFKLKKNFLNNYFEENNDTKDIIEQLMNNGFITVFSPKKTGFFSVIGKFISKYLCSFFTKWKNKKLISSDKKIMTQIRDKILENYKKKEETIKKYGIVGTNNEKKDKFEILIDKLDLISKEDLLKLSLDEQSDYTLLEPNINRKPIKKKNIEKNPTYAIILHYYEKQMQEKMNFELLNIGYNCGEFKRIEDENKKKINEFNEKTKKKTEEKLSKNEKYNNLVDKLKKCSGNVYNSIKFKINEYEYQKDFDEYDDKDIDKLSDRYSDLLYKIITNIYKDNEEKINNDLFDNFLIKFEEIIKLKEKQITSKLEEIEKEFDFYKSKSNVNNEGKKIKIVIQSNVKNTEGKNFGENQNGQNKNTNKVEEKQNGQNKSTNKVDEKPINTNKVEEKQNKSTNKVDEKPINTNKVEEKQNGQNKNTNKVEEKEIDQNKNTNKVDEKHNEFKENKNEDITHDNKKNNNFQNNNFDKDNIENTNNKIQDASKEDTNSQTFYVESEEEAIKISDLVNSRNTLIKNYKEIQKGIQDVNNSNRNYDVLKNSDNKIVKDVIDIMDETSLKTKGRDNINDEIYDKYLKNNNRIIEDSQNDGENLKEREIIEKGNAFINKGKDNPYYHKDFLYIGKQIISQSKIDYEYILIYDDNIIEIGKIENNKNLIGIFKKREKYITFLINNRENFVLYLDNSTKEIKNIIDTDFENTLKINEKNYDKKINEKYINKYSEYSSILSLKNLEIFCNNLKTEEKVFVNNFKNHNFYELKEEKDTKEIIKKIKEMYAKLYLKEVYEIIKNDKLTKDINILIIYFYVYEKKLEIEKCRDKEKLNDFNEIIDNLSEEENKVALQIQLNIIRKMLKEFITENEKKQWKNNINYLEKLNEEKAAE